MQSDNMFVKICGLTDAKEVDYLKDNKVDFAGVVMFFEKSKRNTSEEKAKEIVAAVHGTAASAYSMKAVAVCVSPTKEEIEKIVAIGFDFIQIHGHVDDELLINLKIPVLKAFNLDDLNEYEHYLEIDSIRGFVFDAAMPGSGKPFDWNVLNGLKRQEGILYILAGGLNADNVKVAIEAVNPDGVDVSSGVELTDVILEDGSIKTGKDPEKIELFVRNARM